ncbi:Tripartite ATP-independent transporter DctP family solute receptor OS=Ureibacillus acetophenoni OX=614649 GN=SAMN05877842_102197 PE=3 SV=1 [Ureibacillus acetophenoni]
MKKLYYVLIMGLLTLVVAACGSQTSGESSGTLNLKSADVVAGDSPYTWGMNEYSAKIKELTDGKINIQHFPAGQLGNDGQIVEGVKLGSIDIGMVGTIQSKVTEALYLPFLFSDIEHMHKVLDGEIGEQLKQRFEEETGIKMIGFVYYPSRVLTTKGKEITEVSQLKGLKVRVPEMPPMVATWEALGATPTPIAFTELFSALQSGVVDAQENPYEIIVNNSFYEVQDTVIETHHALPVRFLIMNKKRYDSLTDEQKELLDTTWKETSLAIEKLYLEKEEEYKQKLKDEGMKFITPNIEDFKEATSHVWEEFADEAFGEGVYQKIQDLK